MGGPLGCARFPKSKRLNDSILNLVTVEAFYDVTNLNMELQPNIIFRHRALGFYDAGDLIVRTGGPRPEVLHWPNVLRVRSRLRKIERLIQTREVE